MLNAFLNILRQFGLEYYSKYYSIYQGTIVDNKDPQNRGRVKISVPDVYGSNIPNYWALPKGMFNGNQTSLFAIPTVNDVVWVSFQKGDPRYPVWEYGWFGSGDVPEDAQFDSNEPKSIILQSITKHKIELDDKNNLIRITDSHGNIVELNENGVSVVAENISLGSLNESDEPAAKGDTLMDLLNEFRDDFGKLTAIQTSNGITSTINTSPGWSALVSKWDQKFEEFKSNKVTLD